MDTIVRSRVLFTAVWLFAGLSISESVKAQATTAPLAKASDIDFTIEYSTSNLMLGDLLYANARIRNKMSYPIRFSKFDALVVNAESFLAKEFVLGFGEYPGGMTLSELAPGEEIVYSRALDMFGDDGLENGKFDPFDQSLEGKTVVLRAWRATVPPDDRAGLDYLDYVMTHEHKIQFGAPMISKAAFNEAVAEKLKRPDLKPLKLYFDYLQTSYFFNFTTDRRDLEGNRRSFAAGLKVMSENFPEQSSARRASSILLLVDQFIDANEDVEDQVVSSILAHIAKGPNVERHFWRSYLLRKFESVSAAIGYGGIVSKRKYELFSRRLIDAGF